MYTLGPAIGKSSVGNCEKCRQRHSFIPLYYDKGTKNYYFICPETQEQVITLKGVQKPRSRSLLSRESMTNMPRPSYHNSKIMEMEILTAYMRACVSCKGDHVVYLTKKKGRVFQYRCHQNKILITTIVDVEVTSVGEY